MNWYKISQNEQEISSKDTSVNILPSVFKNVEFEHGTANMDIGGGKYDKATEYLKNLGINNFVYDPYNRTEEHNKRVLENLEQKKPDTATCANVLNVIKEPNIREDVIRMAANYIKEDGTVYFQVWERNKSGIGEKTSKGWQNNQRAEFYIPEIKKYFKNVSKMKNIIIAKDPIQTW